MAYWATTLSGQLEIKIKPKSNQNQIKLSGQLEIKSWHIGPQRSQGS
jgi:hypothetical protein